MTMKERIGIVGLGYVGLPLALAISRKFAPVIGFDINARKIQFLKKGIDRTGEANLAELRRSRLILSSRPADLKKCTFFIVAVPTPVDEHKQPDLTPLIRASETLGKVIQPGAVVVYESTVYPGVTENVCGRVLEQVSGLRRGSDFKLGYSPERINPGDREHSFEKIMKVVSGEDAESLARIAAVYGKVVKAGIHRAPSIRVAEAAKVIENTQRDLNIALMNELALIFDRLGIRTRDVLAAAGTKWNFLKFQPGLVGGHCIGVDPYYLTNLAEQVGYHPQVILAGRRINDGMGAFIGQKLIKLLAQSGSAIKGARVGVLGLTFKENVPDIRNSRVPDILEELGEFGAQTLVSDSRADAEEALAEYGIKLVAFDSLNNLDALILAVPHAEYKSLPIGQLLKGLRSGGILIDVKSILDPADLPPGIRYWCL
jgi:UDP-N-acetyl-D-galactosamine dehydrogenase